ncbi:hypothetical protein [Nocardioides sp. MH1]|uniref:hypothetical protein n=1 Tax=Nocardioides sp. MH1 TaxID=3242490 RepID=UPI00352200E3
MTRHRTAPRSSALRRGWIPLVALLGLLGGVLALAPATATIDGSDLPAKTAVRSALDGTGRWWASTGRVTRTIGGRPRQCRSDRQMLSYEEAKQRGYFGRERGLPRSVTAVVEIAVFHYASVDGAREAVERNVSYPRRCPRVTEWTCTDCDGISTTRRERVRARRVGEQSVAWTYRQVDNLKGSGYAVVARKGSVVIRAEVGRIRDPFPRFVYPPLIKKAEALAIARLALRQAT